MPALGTEGYRLALAAGLDVRRAAVRAADTVRPAILDELCLSCRFIGELLHDLLERDCLPKTFPACGSHAVTT